MRRAALWVGVGAVLVVVAFAALGRSGGRTVRATSGPIDQGIAALAVVEPAGGPSLVEATVAARVTEVAVRVGDRVRERALLARLEGGAANGGLQDLTSPVSGTIVRADVRVGDLVSSQSPPLFVVADLERLEVRLEIAELDAGRVAAGRAVEVRPRGGGATMFRSTLERLSPVLEEPRIGVGDARTRASGRIRVGWIPVPRGAAVLAGQRLEAWIRLPPRAVKVRLPRGAVSLQDGRGVIRVPWGPFSREKVVRLGLADGRFVAVSGISPGTDVLVPDE